MEGHQLIIGVLDCPTLDPPMQKIRVWLY